MTGSVNLRGAATSSTRPKVPSCPTVHWSPAPRGGGGSTVPNVLAVQEEAVPDPAPVMTATLSSRPIRCLRRRSLDRSR